MTGNGNVDWLSNREMPALVTQYTEKVAFPPGAGRRPAGYTPYLPRTWCVFWLLATDAVEAAGRECKERSLATIKTGKNARYPYTSEVYRSA